MRFPRIGAQPAVVLSVNPVNLRLGHVAVIPITGTEGPASTNIPLTADSYADITGLQPAARTSCRKRRGLLTHGELAHIEVQLRTYLGL